MPLTPEELVEIKARADEIWGPGPPKATTDRDAYTEEFIDHVARLKRDNLRLVEEVERLWGKSRG
jgi:hypothetical protein